MSNTATQERQEQDVRQGSQQEMTSQRQPMNLERIFAQSRASVQPKNSNETSKYEYLRTAFKNIAQSIVDIVPPGADQAAAIRLVREAWYTSEAGLELGGQL